MECCPFCGRYVFPVPGWTATIAVYHAFPVAWESGQEHFFGSLHFSFLRESPQRAVFVESFLRFATSTYYSDELGNPRPGLYFTVPVHTAETFRIFRHGVSDELLVVENDGPWFFLPATSFPGLRRGELPRGGGGVGSVVLPESGSVEKEGQGMRRWPLEELLTRVGVRDLYEDVLAIGRPAYEFFDFYPPKRILDYSVTALEPLSREARDYLAEYVGDYVPFELPDLP